ncbi:hypothetical protein BV25DRAFT_1822082 [Artomyces pyxidatus]|uniref:Uncharacterized protein n=1 Tax=Artomyces pyxidatus TaxID=48021 RepID=A0ACB8T9W5_9AGAM|nr:hypothetical protein BV25DRAFT_1822082 [Artomyces pyxidatus]
MVRLTTAFIVFLAAATASALPANAQPAAIMKRLPQSDSSGGGGGSDSSGNWLANFPWWIFFDGPGSGGSDSS